MTPACWTRSTVLPRLSWKNLTLLQLLLSTVSVELCLRSALRVCSITLYPWIKDSNYPQLFTLSTAAMNTWRWAGLYFGSDCVFNLNAIEADGNQGLREIRVFVEPGTVQHQQSEEQVFSQAFLLGQQTSSNHGCRCRDQQLTEGSALSREDASYLRFLERLFSAHSTFDVRPGSFKLPICIARRISLGQLAVPDTVSFQKFVNFSFEV